MRKIFKVYFRDKEYYVYDIPNKEHEGLNGEPKTWWIYFSENLPVDIEPPIDSEYFLPYSYSILRSCWDIRFKQSNSAKHKWDDFHFRNHVHTEMYCNNKLIYSFGTSGKALDFAFAKAQYLMIILSEHPFNFFEPEKENGRKIYWYGLPAFINTSGYNSWEIRILPDYEVLSKNKWWTEYLNRTKNISETPTEDDIEEINEYIGRDEINWGDALSDQHINWFRK